MYHNQKQITIEVDGISKSFGHYLANDNISLAVEPGDICGLLGPNGAGKTTLIRQCAGLLEPDAGQVKIMGLVQSTSNLNTRKQMGLVSNDAPLISELKVIEALKMQSLMYGLSGNAAKSAIKVVVNNFQLQEFISKYVADLSTGMRQRVKIAAAMMHKPKLLLLDEPTLGLDTEVRHSIWCYLKKIAADGVAIILTTHYLKEASFLCNKIHLLVDGKTAASISAADQNYSADMLEDLYREIVTFDNPDFID